VPNIGAYGCLSIMFLLRQVQDWKRHKPFCKPNTKSQKVSPSSDSTCGAIEKNFGIKERERADMQGELMERENGKEFIIEVPAPSEPGGKLKIASTTLPPLSMRVMKSVFEKDEPST
jgi:hypothetical protein